jgi:glutathione peroxidase
MKVRSVRVAALGVITVAALVSSLAVRTAAQQPRAGGAVTSFYDMKTMTLDGKPADLGMYKGKVSLVVNVASKCGFTPQYEGLEKLQREMKGKPFNVLGFPSNDFGGQEPGTPAEIQEFCKLTYDVTFPIFEKVVTKAGAAQSPIYKFSAPTASCPRGTSRADVVDKNGQIVVLPGQVTPESKELRDVPAKAIGG